MSLRILTTILLGITFMVTLLLARLFLENSLITEFRRIESEQMERNLSAVLTSLENELNSLDKKCEWWAEESDLVEKLFPVDSDGFAAELLENEGVDIIFLADRQGLVDKSLYLPSAPGKIMNPENVNEASIEDTPEFMEKLKGERQIFNPGGIGASTTGAVTVDGVSVLVASRPMRGSTGASQSERTLVFGRFVDAGLRERLAALTSLSVSLIPVTDEESMRDRLIEVQASHGKREYRTVVQPGDSISTTDYLEDFSGSPGMLVEVSGSRQFFRQGMSFGRRMFLSLMLFLAGGSLLAVLLLEKIVLGPVAVLNAKVRAVDAPGGEEPIGSARGTELTRLSHEFDHMVLRLNESRRRLEDHQARLRSLASQITVSETRERSRIANEIHDGLGPRLSMMKVKLSTLRESIGEVDAAYQLEEILLDIRKVIEDTRKLTFELNPPILFELGLGKALDWLCERRSEMNGVTVSYCGPQDEPDLSEELAILLYSAARELLSNALKHSGSDACELCYSCSDGVITLVVKDGGVGFDSERLDEICREKHAFGLFSLRERVQGQGGEMRISSGPGRGTEIMIGIPVCGTAGGENAG